MHIHSSKENFQTIKTHDIQSIVKKLSSLNALGITTGGDAYFTQLSKLAPNHLQAIFESGHLRYNQRKFNDAIAILSKGLSLHPNQTSLRTLLLACYKDNNDIKNMLILAQQMADSLASDDEIMLAYTSFLHACDWESANKIEPIALQVIQKGNVSTRLIPNFLLSSNGLSSFSREASYQVHRKWGKSLEKNEKASFSKKINRRIRIAYISADFYRHPVGFFMLDIIAKHHKDIFEIFCYANLAGHHDEVTDMFIANADHFIDISSMDNHALFTKIRQDKIHIAIDLGSHTANSRTPIFANRIAPVQISYLGYPNTTGLKAMDFHITDHFAEDLKKGTRYTEKLLFMPKTFLCYGMEWNIEKKATAPCEETGHITFASFNDRRKMNLDVIQTWASILSQVPNSRLLLKFAASGDPIIIDFIHQAFEQFGIDASRIILLPLTVTEADHILYYHQIDIALDPFPYTGTTTTCEALSQGVPVITLVGPQHSHRVSYSILKNIGFEETITYSKEEYIAKAVQLASNPQGLSTLRGCLPLLLQYSPLRNSEQFVSDLEALYKQACKKKGLR